ncbi:MAG: 5-formyltetrahydrofolate cyclo-ligase [Nitrospirae bacterium GWC2_42_7]|nr:MAG: 5-formyltetrahydrofolate cyclo-ligase [Nitrospirae bacterium GWC2_42_7]
MLDKASLRKDFLKKRDRIPTEVRKIKDKMIAVKLASLEEFRNAGVVFYFASFRTEVDTLGMIRASILEGKRVLLPKVDKEGHNLRLFEIKSTDELTSGYMGIPEPSVLSEDRIAGINEADVVIIPGAGFDMSGNRIGYGAGYYDKLLSGLTKNIVIIAPAYEEQIADSIPSEPHDIKVNIIVTDRRVIRCVTEG